MGYDLITVHCVHPGVLSEPGRFIGESRGICSRRCIPTLWPVVFLAQEETLVFTTYTEVSALLLSPTRDRDRIKTQETSALKRLQFDSADKPGMM